MKNKKIKTYKPKESNVVKLDTFLQKLNKDGYTFRK
jgi:hypothetical protein